MKTTKILGALTVSLLTLAFASKVEAAQLKSSQLSLSTSNPAVQATHTFNFTHVSSSSLREIKFEYCKTPSGACAVPASLVTTTVADGVYTGLSTPADWKVTNGGNGTVILFDTVGADTALNPNTPVSLSFGSITNSNLPDVGANATSCDAQNLTLPVDASSDTCYVRITTYTDAGSTVADVGTVSYTVISTVSVTARVDPTFTFVVQAVPLNTVHGGVTTSVTSTFGELPFGNLTAGTPKYAAHALFVTTNTVTGYTVSAKMSTQMVGVYTGNNIDPFVAPWGTPTTWTEPTGSTPNDNTAWFGANSTDSTLSGWGAPTEKFGGIGGSAVVVKQKGNSDNGTMPTYLTYALEANVFQPADTYTGELVYNALPTY